MTLNNKTFASTYERTNISMLDCFGIGAVRIVISAGQDTGAF